ncbi:ParB/RepB/Spo0J family partition protein [Exiguobacterium sp. KJ 601]|uniref:ParB/RepB/Spo0J family partition protein n=1 Tax=Exiguobacterium sp. KJ 601 TaxID=2782569 RepID=UPI0022B0563C|nr:ParB/RepB/Spo0J family partition protein [Exiguobacterium sp. KJ 601]
MRKGPENINLRKRIGEDISLTEQKRKLTLKGETRVFDVYRIPLEHLVYNRRNGRIISWMNRVESEGEDVSTLDKNEYNDKVEEMIIESNKGALEKTKANIKNFGQRVPGVVLNDGTIVDGNRRFTCLRHLRRDHGMDVFFEAIILDPKEGLSDIDIKRLELNLQHGEERPVDYNPIDNLVDVYNDIVVNEYFTEQEYALNTNKKLSEVKKMVEKAKLMVEYLEFINADGKFYLARELELDGPLQEMVGILKNEKDEEERIRVTDTLFTALTISKNKDLTRYIRRIGNDILKASNREAFLEEFDEIVYDVADAFQGKEKVDLEAMRQLNSEMKDLRDEAASLIDRRADETAISRAKMRPIDAFNTSLKTLDTIDMDHIGRLDQKNREEFIRLMGRMRGVLDSFEERLS